MSSPSRKPSREPRRPPSLFQPVLEMLRSFLPKTPREFLAAAITFVSSLGGALLIETFFENLKRLIPVALFVPIGLFLLSTRLLRAREQNPESGEPVEPGHLPPRIDALIGRDSELEEAVDRVRDRGLVVVRGLAKIGTSALAVDVGWSLAPEVELQHYADLRRQDRNRAEDVPSVIRRVLRTLGRPLGSAEDPEEAEREVLSTLRDTGRVLLLDNVERWSQVAWLPRHVPGSWVIVAGEVRTDGGEAIPTDVAVVRLDPLSPADGVALLRSQVAADRVDAAPEATERLATLFLRRPAIAAGIGRWLAENPQVTIASLVKDLESRPNDPTLQVLLDMQLGRTRPAARRLLASLAHTPISELGIDCVTALAGESEHEVEQTMQELNQHGLVEKVRESRFRVVDAARPIVQPPENQGVAWRRLLEYFAERADFFAERLPQREARTWFGIEDRALLQILRMPRPAPWASGPLWRIADALEVWFLLEQRHEERRDAARALAYAARTLKAEDVQATAELRLCQIALVLGDPREAQRRFDGAAGLQTGVESWPAQLHLARAATLLATGDEFASVESSLVRYAQKLPGDDVSGQTTRWINMAVLQIRRGQVCGFEEKDRAGEADRLYTDAFGMLIQALGGAQQTGDVNAEAHALELLALVNHFMEREQEATAKWAQAVVLYRRSGDMIGQARCQMNQAAALPAARHRDAARLLRSALRRLPPTGVSTALARLHLARVDPRNAQAQRERGLAALAPWDGVAEPLQVAEIRKRLLRL
ncbi:hypothetical protein [Streptosporangium sp. NPDC051022]|uniref:hypothetical protein n=1 Tax=Streptosporangium sp. NPDC051022 TaxID=3155752 RepID=UPI0034165765